jgi:hypothetical protein
MGVQPEVHIDREQFGIAMLAGAPESVFGGKAEVGLRGRQRSGLAPVALLFFAIVSATRQTALNFRDRLIASGDCAVRINADAALA